MNTTPLKLSLAAILALGMSATAFAQSYTDPAAQAAYDQSLRTYQDQQENYQSQQQSYENAKAAADARRYAYLSKSTAYSADRYAYLRERDDYDAKYGAGAWEARYGYSYHRHDDLSDYYRVYRDSPCERRAGGDAVAGGVIGALAGAAIGSNLAGHGARGAGAVLGAFAGGAIGSSVAVSAAHCDARGYYFNTDQTYAYREPDIYADAASGRYDYRTYRRLGCRLAAAPAYDQGVTDYRYVRVCPDSDGRYRITG